MNLNHLISFLDLKSIDQDEVKAVGERRGFMKKAGEFSLKAALAMLGRIQNSFRLPLVPLASQHEAAVRDALRGAGALS